MIKDSLLAMMDSVSQLMRDATKYLTAGNSNKINKTFVNPKQFSKFYRDESDEDNCEMLVMKATYNSKIAPFAFDYVKSEVIPVNVNVSMAVIDVLSISEKDLVYVLKFRFLMVWYDYRLKYHNLKESRSLNSLGREDIDKLWIPFIVFSNTEKSESTKGNDETEVTISREGDFAESAVNVMEEINIFDGNQNRITFQQIYSKTFKCLYQLHLYPFDTQVISD